MPAATARSQPVADPATGEDAPADLLIIGGGVNGAGIAREAALRGLSVVLAEAGDLAQGTSSSSTKLFHGGLRYLEHFAFRLVRESLAEREVLLRAMPHIAWPLRFVLPHHPGLRPAWMLRAGLFLYDHMGGRRLLPATRAVTLAGAPLGEGLAPHLRRGFEYSDVWVDDARLVMLNARSAQAAGARILTRSRVVSARVEAGLWEVRLEGGTCLRARTLVNAAGPWVGAVLAGVAGRNAPARLRLVRGRHIIVRRLFTHDRALTLQGGDGRVAFAIPYEQDFTLIGTTEVAHEGDPAAATCTDEEAAYLCRFVSDYLARPVTPADIVWRYAGVRPLYDDGARSDTQATRDYVLHLDQGQGAVLLNVFGGKITTYRRLSRAALDHLAPHLAPQGGAADTTTPLPGGDFPVDGVAAQVAALRAAHPFLDAAWAGRLVRAYGTEAAALLGGARTRAALGRDFGATLTEAELDWMHSREWARSAEDALWRRSKLGLRLSTGQVAQVAQWFAAVR
ncbi:MAG: glycerol-3-phosphate dehydrogenase [Rhodobacteraceae bacterium]|nr:glycerol-3-phosphate dehydrogenase [Paracoccaceae bacterium]